MDFAVFVLHKKMCAIMSVKFIAQRLQEFHFGHLVLSKLTFILTVVNFLVLISIRWGFDPINYLIFIVPLCVFIIWFLGWALERKGLRRSFIQAQFKDVRVK